MKKITLKTADGRDVRVRANVYSDMEIFAADLPDNVPVTLDMEADDDLDDWLEIEFPGMPEAEEYLRKLLDACEEMHDEDSLHYYISVTENNYNVVDWGL